MSNTKKKVPRIDKRQERQAVPLRKNFLRCKTMCFYWIIGETPINGIDDRVDTCILDFSFPQYVESTRTSNSSPQNGKYKIIENYKVDVIFHFFFLFLL